MGFPCGSVGKESTCKVGELGSIPGLGRSPGEGKGFLLQYSGLENSMNYIVHGDTKSQTHLSNFHWCHLATRGCPSLKLPRFLPKVHPRTTEPDLCPLLGTEHRAATPRPIPTVQLPSYCFLPSLSGPEHLSPEMEQERAKWNSWG